VGSDGGPRSSSASFRRAAADRIADARCPLLSHCSTGFHVADLEQSNNPLQSVTQSTSVEEFMAVATMSERDFTAERGKLTFVHDDAGAAAARKAVV
jgi:hypothetical protein